jgi:hypothetical protein
MTTCGHPTEVLVRRVRGEYWEMPGLRLNVPQAQRLWALDAATCESLLHSLVEDGFLAHTRDGSYVRSESY